MRDISRVINILRSEKPDLLYLYEEPNSLVTIQMLLLARYSLPRLKTIVWTACNTKRDYKEMYRFFDIRRYFFDLNISAELISFDDTPLPQ